MRARIFAALCVALMGLTGCIGGGKNFVYVTGPGTNEVFGFRMHSDGSITPLNVPNFTSGSGPAALAIHPPGDFFYIANSAGANVTLLDINTGNGELTVPPTNAALPPLTPANIFNAGTAPVSMAIAPNQPRLYVANRDSGDITAFLIDPTNGNLGSVPGSPFPVAPGAATASNPQAVVMTPAGNFLYTANPAQGTIAGFAVNSDGSLTAVAGSPFAVGTAGTSPTSLAVNPNGKVLYAADAAHSAVMAFGIQSDGTIGAISGSPFPAGVGTTALSIAPQGSLMYAANFNDNTVSAFVIDPNSGSLSQVNGSPFTTGGRGPGAVLATGAFVYVGDQITNDIAAFAIGSNGALTTVKGSPFAVPVSPTAIVAAAEK